jgi:hypothetical protein
MELHVKKDNGWPECGVALRVVFASEETLVEPDTREHHCGVHLVLLPGGLGGKPLRATVELLDTGDTVLVRGKLPPVETRSPGSGFMWMGSAEHVRDDSPLQSLPVCTDPSAPGRWVATQQLYPPPGGEPGERWAWEPPGCTHLRHTGATVAHCMGQSTWVFQGGEAVRQLHAAFWSHVANETYYWPGSEMAVPNLHEQPRLLRFATDGLKYVSSHLVADAGAPPSDASAWIVSYGAGDALSGTTTDAFRENLRDWLAANSPPARAVWVTAPTVKPGLTGAPPFGLARRIRDLNKVALQEVRAAWHGVAIVDFEALTAALPGEFTFDGMHWGCDANDHARVRGGKMRCRALANSIAANSVAGGLCSPHRI